VTGSTTGAVGARLRLANLNSVVQSGTGVSVTYGAGQSVKISPPAGVGALHVTPSLNLENTFSSSTWLAKEYDLYAQALAFSYDIPGYGSRTLGPVLNKTMGLPTCDTEQFHFLPAPALAKENCDLFDSITPPSQSWSLDGFQTVEEQPFDLVFDTTPPVTTASVSPTPNANGWNNADATVSLHAVDLPADTASGVNATYYAVDNSACSAGARSNCMVYDAGNPPMIRAEGRHTVYFFSVDNAGNAEAQESQAMNVDKTSPGINGGPVNADGTARPANGFGWYDSPVDIAFRCSDPAPSDGGAASGVAGCTGNTTLGEGTNQSVTGTASDRAGNSADATVSGINVDLTDPAVTYSGDTGGYTIDQMVSITCATNDPIHNGTASGINPATDTCQNVSGPAYSFHVANLGGSGDPGTNAYSAQVQDKAGNLGTRSTSFTVYATFDSLCTVTRRFIPDSDVADGLCAKLNAAAQAQAAGQTQPMDNILGAYIHQVSAQTGKALTDQQAGILTQLAQALM
jgi:hypothetical protein